MTDQNGLGPLQSADPNRELGKYDKARDLAHRGKEKTKKLLSLEDNGTTPSNASDTPQNDDPRDVSSDPAFNPALITKKSTSQSSNGESKTVKSGLKSAARAIAHPRQAGQSKATRSAAGRISEAQRPYISAGDDRTLLAAHDELTQAALGRSSMQGRTSEESQEGNSDEAKAAREKVESIEEDRAGLQAGWTVSRHVDRVKILQAPASRPRYRNDFVEHTSSGEPERFQWERWLAYQTLYYTHDFTARYVDDSEDIVFNIEELYRTVERFAIVTAPWQAWLVSVRQVYIWQDPKRTSKWLLLYCILWYTDHLVGFVWAFVIYTALRNRSRSESLKSLRDTMKRGDDHDTHAQAWGELVQRHGRKDWLEPLLDEIGGSIQLQLGDFTDLLEMLANFYRWKSPWKTAESVFFFSTCLLITLLTDMAFCVKLVGFISGGWFFFCFPIATRYPRYRYLVDPFRWVLWDIPTNAQWSIELLRRKASARQMEMIEKKGENVVHYTSTDESSGSDYDTPPPSPRIHTEESSLGKDADIFETRAYQLSRSKPLRGSLHLNRSALRFSSRRRTWSIPYNRLIEMCKVNVRPSEFSRKAIVALNIVTTGDGAGLRLVTSGSGENVSTEQTLVMNEDTRDEIFNLVVGWSGLGWRAVRTQSATET